MIGGAKTDSKQRKSRRRIWSFGPWLSLLWIHFGSSSNDDQKNNCRDAREHWSWECAPVSESVSSFSLFPLSLKALRTCPSEERGVASSRKSFHRPRCSLRTLVICYVFISLSSVYNLTDRNWWLVRCCGGGRSLKFYRMTHFVRYCLFWHFYQLCD